MALVKCKECGKEVSDKSKTCPNCGAPIKSSISILKLLVILILIYIIISTVINESVKSDQKPPSTSSPAIENKYEKAMESTKLKTEWNKAGFDRVLEADFVVTNDSNYSIKDFEITCTTFGASLTAIGINRKTFYNTIGWKEKLELNKVNMGIISDQVNHVSCTVTDLKVL